MENARLVRLFSIAGLVFVLSCPAGFAALQQDRDPAAPSTQHHQEQAPDTANGQSDVKVFAGKIMNSGDQLVLKNTATQSAYPLDDQERAKSFEGRDVKVMGALDPITGALHIKGIELASGN